MRPLCFEDFVNRIPDSKKVISFISWSSCSHVVKRIAKFMNFMMFTKVFNRN